MGVIYKMETRVNMRLTKETKKELDLIKVEKDLKSYEELMKYLISRVQGE